MNVIQGDYRNIVRYCNEAAPDGYFRFEFAYTPTDERFREIDRFLWESRHQCTRFENYYLGPVAIGLDEWNGKSLNCYFDAFMYFIKDYMRSAEFCMFYVEKRASKELLEKLEEHFSVNLVELGLTERRNEPSRRVIGFDMSA